MINLKFGVVVLFLLLGACAGVDPYARKNPDNFDYEAEYTAFLRVADLSKLSDFYVDISKEKNIDIQSKGCIASLNTLQRQLQKNHLSIAANYYLMKCHAEKGNAGKAAYHETLLRKIFTGMYAGRDGSNQASAIPYLTNSDVLISLMLANYQLLDAYLELEESGKKAFFVALIRDNDNGEISKKYFTNSEVVDALYKKIMPELFGGDIGFGSGLMLLKSLEKENTTEALLSLGDYYRTGKWEEQNYTKAAEYYGKAVDKGSVVGRVRLAELYILGRGVDQDHNKAIDLLLQGLEMGYVDAEIPMAILYKYGKGVDKSMDSYHALLEDVVRQIGEGEAYLRMADLIQKTFTPVTVQHDVIQMLEKAANSGNAAAMLQRGRLSESGYGDYAADKKLARIWYQRLVEMGNAEGYLALGDMESARGQFDKAFEYYFKAAESGVARAQSHLCRYYHKGVAVKPNQEKAVAWCKRGVGQNDADALFNYATLFGLGLVDDQLRVEKQYWLYGQAAIQGSADAQMNLAALFLDGRIKNKQGHYNWLKKAAENGNVQAQYELGIEYYNGNDADALQAIHFLEKAAAQDHVDAMLKLAELYQNPDFRQPDTKLAEYWYKKAQHQGSRVAKWRLEDLKAKRPMQKPFATLSKYGIYNVEEETASEIATAGEEVHKKAKYKRKELVARTEHVPAILGQRFHIELLLYGLPEGENELNIEVEHPAMIYPDGIERNKVNWSKKIHVDGPVFVENIGWHFEHLYELVAGQWVFRYIYNKKVVAEKYFFTYRIQE